MSWNSNSIGKDDFLRVSLIEAHNSIFNYNIMSTCETSLNDLVALPETRLNGYRFVSSNNPRLCLPTIQLTLEMVGWVSFINILSSK